jgi:hypothetical protein
MRMAGRGWMRGAFKSRDRASAAAATARGFQKLAQIAPGVSVVGSTPTSFKGSWRGAMPECATHDRFCPLSFRSTEQAKYMVFYGPTTHPFLAQ